MSDVAEPIDPSGESPFRSWYYSLPEVQNMIRERGLPWTVSVIPAAHLDPYEPTFSGEARAEWRLCSSCLRDGALSPSPALRVSDLLDHLTLLLA